MTGGGAVRGLLKQLRGLDDPRQACNVTWQNRRCSMRFHFDVPGG
jgi:hypothetical protein